MKHWDGTFYFQTACIRKKNLMFFGIGDSSVDETGEAICNLVSWKSGQWGGDNDNWDVNAVSGSVCLHPKEQSIVISSSGQSYLIGSGEDGYEQIGGKKALRGPLRRVRSIGGKAHVVGMMRQVYRREDANKWVAIDTPAMRKATEVVGFETIDGFAEDDLYCAGWEGEIWHYNGTKWRQIHSPTNIILMDMCCVPDGKVYICGQMGKILRGRDDTWEVIEHDGPKANWWNCCWYQDKLWLVTDRGLFTLEKNDKLVAVDFGDEDPSTFRHLSTADGVLLSTGAKDVLLFDGTRWTRID